MEVEAFLVANRAEVRDGLLHVEGGGWEHYSPLFFPWTLSGVVVALLAVDPSEAGSTPTVCVDLNDHSGHVEGFHGSMVAAAIRPVIPGVPWRVPVVVPFCTVVSGSTTVNVKLSIGNVEVDTLAFPVRDPVPDSPDG